MTSLKAVSPIKIWFMRDCILIEFCISFFYDKIHQIYLQHWVWKFYWHILSKYQQQIPKKLRGGWGWLPTPPCSARSCFYVITFWMHYTLFVIVFRINKFNCYCQLNFPFIRFFKIIYDIFLNCDIFYDVF